MTTFFEFLLLLCERTTECVLQQNWDLKPNGAVNETQTDKQGRKSERIKAIKKCRANCVCSI